MVVRELPAEEWGRLEGHEALLGAPLPDPSHSRVVVAEDGEEIVAAWFLTQVVHIEPLWIHPQYRRKLLPARLFPLVCSILDSCSIFKAFCLVDTPAVSNYAQRLGMKQLPYDLFQYEVPSCLPPLTTTP